jgi:hypothetical protein
VGDHQWGIIMRAEHVLNQPEVFKSSILTVAHVTMLGRVDGALASRDVASETSQARRLDPCSTGAKSSRDGSHGQ